MSPAAIPRSTRLTGPHRAQRGFTLIELLVVAGLVTLLLGFLLPTLKRVQHAAQLVVCESNLRQMGAAAQTYATNNQDWIPRDAFSNSDAFFAPCLGKLMVKPPPDETIVVGDVRTGPRVQVDLKYCSDWLRSVKIFKCPAVLDERFVLHYAVNSLDFQTFLGSKSPAFAETPWQRLSAVPNRSNAAYIVEANMTTLDPAALGQFNIYRPDDLPYYFPPSLKAGQPTPSPRMISADDNRHGGRTALLFFDWHAESKSLKVPGEWQEALLTGRPR